MGDNSTPYVSIFPEAQNRASKFTFAFLRPQHACKQSINSTAEALSQLKSSQTLFSTNFSLARKRNKPPSKRRAGRRGATWPRSAFPPPVAGGDKRRGGRRMAERAPHLSPQPHLGGRRVHGGLPLLASYGAE